MIRNNASNRKALANALSQAYSEFGSKAIKSTIGDSVNNNRVATVSQVSRFLRTRRRPSLIRTSRLLDGLYPVLSSQAVALSRRNSSRTDALDINEFILFLRNN